MLCEYWGSLSESKDPKFKNKAKVFDALEQHRDRVKDYLWLAADGMKMQVRTVDPRHVRVIVTYSRQSLLR